MNKLINKAFVLTAFFGLTLSSCNYLDIVPEETAKFEDTYADRQRGREFLYSCYSYLPNPQDGPNSLDLMTGDEVITAFEHEPFAHFPKGTYSPSDPKISYWNTFFEGLRQCYTFMNVIDKLPSDTTPEEKADYKAQVKFLIAYYHYQLALCYGPIIIIDKEPDLAMKPENYPSRRPYDECVKWICDKFDEAAAGLPARRTMDEEFGLATKTAAKAFKAKMLLFAASPLFNGNAKFYGNFKDKEGKQLMPTTYDPKKWDKAKKAYEEAIALAEAQGFSLYERDDYRLSSNAKPQGIQRRMRTLILDWDKRNPEVIFADPRDPGSYGLQNKSYPFVKGGNAWNGVSPTWAMISRFYTKNGLPWDVDPETKTLDKFDTRAITEEEADFGVPGKKTLEFHLNREPRFYSWVGFQFGYYEISEGESGVYSVGTTLDAGEVPGANGQMMKYRRVKLNFFSNQAQGRQKRKNDYSPGGYLNKKGCDPTIEVNKSGSQYRHYPWPLMRLADLYLAYAEVCVETGDLAKAKEYLNKVRVRAGIPTVEESWAKAGVTNLTKEQLRDIVRQERQIEFYLENQNFWDMRRWLLAEKYFSVKAEGMDISKSNAREGFFKLTKIEFERSFESPKNYLLPIPILDLQKNKKLVQNPGY